MIRRCLFALLPVAVVVGCTHAQSDAAPTATRPAPKPAPDASTTTALFHFHDGAIVESSGISASSYRDHLIYTHNDSGDTARFFAVDFHGCTVTRFGVSGAAATDWEDMARGPGPSGDPTLWLGDIGDNLAERPSIQVYAVAEPRPRVPAYADGSCPRPKEKTIAGIRYDLAYPDGAHNAESLMVDPDTGRLYIVTKPVGSDERPTLYVAPRHLDRSRTNTLRKLRAVRLPGQPRSVLVTGADISHDGRRVVVRTYGDAYEWTVRHHRIARAMSRTPRVVDLPPQPQGEAIGYTRHGHGLLISSEDPQGSKPPVFLVPASA